MSKKTQGIIWLVVAIIAAVIIGYVIYSTVMFKVQTVKHPEVSFEIEGYGTVKMELYPEYAPNTVVNFIKLAQAGYYNGKVVYGKDTIAEYWGRSQDGTVENPKASLVNSSIESGSEGDFDYEIEGEFIANKFNQNTLSHKRGIVSMVRADYTSQMPSLIDESYNSASSQFSVIVSDNSKSLNGLYAGFGRITEGMDIVDQIYNSAINVDEGASATDDLNTVSSDESSSIQKFETYPVISSTTVETYGVDYGSPVIKKAFDYSSYLYQLMSQYYGY